jgi:mono/diheme cytochrome c family protein
MSKGVLLVLLGALLLSFGLLKTVPHGEGSRLQTGQYLAHDVAQCVECHTPRNSKGKLDRRQVFGGAPIPVRSPYPTSPWAFRAPALAGLPGWKPQDVVHLLRTGRRVGGRSPQPPMPSFRMSAEDAAAVTAYLESLR